MWYYIQYTKIFKLISVRDQPKSLLPLPSIDNAKPNFSPEPAQSIRSLLSEADCCPRDIKDRNSCQQLKILDLVDFNKQAMSRLSKSRTYFSPDLPLFPWFGLIGIVDEACLPKVTLTFLGRLITPCLLRSMSVRPDIAVRRVFPLIASGCKDRIFKLLRFF